MMKITRQDILKVTCAVFVIMIGWSLMEGNETILPTALVGSLLCLLLILNGNEKITQPNKNEILLGSAGRYTLVSFAILIAVSSLLVSVFLPGFAEANNLTGLYDGDFVRVTINDFHEFAYMTSFLLMMSIAFMVYFRRREYAEMTHGSCI
jgi:uncharacterized membrane protein